MIYNQIYNSLEEFPIYDDALRDENFRLRIKENDEDEEMVDQTVYDLFLKYNN